MNTYNFHITEFSMAIGISRVLQARNYRLIGREIQLRSSRNLKVIVKMLSSQLRY